MKRLVVIFVILIMACLVFTGCDIVDSAIDGVNASKHNINNAIIGLFHKHSYNEKKVVAATDEADGYTMYVCACGDIYVGDCVSTLGHTEVIDAAVPATCTTTGLTEGKHCARCNEVIVAQQTVAMVDHDYVNYICMDCGSTAYSHGLEYTLSDDGDYYIVTGIGNCIDSDIVIPPSYNGLPVGAIGGGAFMYCTNIISVVIPDSVTYIAKNGEGTTFWGCTSLETVVIPDSVTSIGAFAGEHAFKGCYKICEEENGVCYVNNWAMTGIGPSDGEHSRLVIREGTIGIAAQAFIFRNYREVVIPNSVKYVSEVAFCAWSNAEKVYYLGTPEEWSEILIASMNEGITNTPIYYYSETVPTEEGNFWHYVGGVPTVWDVYNDPGYSVGLEYTSNGDGTCYVSGIGTCTDTDIVIPSVSPEGWTVVGIGACAFENCNIESVEYPSTITYIGYGAFINTALKTIVIPDSVTSIADGAFSFCYQATTVIVGNGLTYLPLIGWHGCPMIVSVTIGENVEHLGIGPCDLHPIEIINKSKYDPLSTGEGPLFADTALAIHSGETKIVTYNDYLFCILEGKNYLIGYVGNEKHLVLPENYNGETYEIYRFRTSNTSFTSVVIPDSVTSIGDYAFSGYSSLTTINYRGTKEEWNAITKGDNWNSGTGNYTIVYNYNGE